MKFVRVYFLSYILWEEVLKISSMSILETYSTRNYYDGLIYFLKEESKLHQVVFILDDQYDNWDPVMNSLIKTVEVHFPSLSLSYNKTGLWFYRFYRSSFRTERHYRRSTLFVFQTNNNSTVQRIENTLLAVNGRTDLALPRCLIMNSFNSSLQYLNTTLHSLWLKNYLDITIMTYDQKYQVTPFLSQLNPFNKTFTTQKMSYATQWFPNKIHDLNGHNMSLNYNFLLTEKRDIEIREKITQIFSQAMNFKHRKGIKDTLRPHYLGYIPQQKIEKNIELFYSARSLRILKIDTIKAVIPKKKFSNVLVISSNLLQMILGTICTIIIIRLVALRMRFKTAAWRTLNISQIIIGMPPTQEPNNWIERIVFGSLLIACTVYTGYFYSVILDIGLQIEPEISTLKELADSSLTPLVSNKSCTRLQSSPNPYIRTLGRRCKIISHSMLLDNNYCLEYLARNKNVSCMYADAEYQVNTYSSVKRKELNVTILPEAVDYYTFHWTAKNNPPFTDRYNEIILRASEFGFFKEYYYLYKVPPSKTLPPEEIKKAKLFFIASYVLGIGYSLSVIVFLFEIFAAMLHKRMYTFYNSFRI